jgi:GNAT superfamily N-acetyltransferase
MTRRGLTSPVPLTEAHDLDPFACGVETLDHWLKRQALRNEIGGASRTYVVCDGAAVVAYYCLAAGAVERNDAPKPMQRNMPDPIPVLVLGRLAVDQRYQNRGIGAALLRDAFLRALQVGDVAGIKAVLVHAISEEAKAWYLARGFQESPIAPMTLCLALATVRQALRGE